jgi:hypothetical protein
MKSGINGEGVCRSLHCTILNSVLFVDCFVFIALYDILYSKRCLVKDTEPKSPIIFQHNVYIKNLSEKLDLLYHSVCMVILTGDSCPASGSSRDAANDIFMPYCLLLFF